MTAFALTTTALMILIRIKMTVTGILWVMRVITVWVVVATAMEMASVKEYQLSAMVRITAQASLTPIRQTLMAMAGAMRVIPAMVLVGIATEMVFVMERTTVD
jgi:hypothetical protein